MKASQWTLHSFYYLSNLLRMIIYVPSSCAHFYKSVCPTFLIAILYPLAVSITLISLSMFAYFPVFIYWNLSFGIQFDSLFSNLKLLELFFFQKL